MSAIVYLEPGDIMGAYRVLSVHTPASASRDRLYAVESLCCGESVVRGHDALLEGRRLGRMHCPRCAQKTKNDNRPYAVGDVVGPVTVVAMAQPLWRQVEWSCCDALEVVSINRLHQLKHRQRDGFTQLCGACNRERARTRQQGPWMQATATLPMGVLPAGAAWPRPGVGT
jgi:hypothetical protein